MKNEKKSENVNSNGSSGPGPAATSNVVFAGFLAFNGLIFFVVAALATLLGCAYLYPKFVFLFVIVPYYTYVLVLGREEMKDGSHWHRFSTNFPLFRIMRQFLHLKLVASKELTAADEEKGSQFVLAVFPHGTNSDFRILMDGVLPSVLPNSAENTRTLAATVLFRIPIVREVALWTGCIDARRAVADRALDNGRSILVLPGGQAEQIRTVYEREKVYLQPRKGFIKLAMKHNVPVVPVYVFGASDYYKTSSILLKFRLWLVKYAGISIPMCWGQWASMTCPLPVPTTVVFGNPVLYPVKQACKPTAEEVETAHTQFCNALERLFDEHKTDLGYGDRKLEIL